MRKLLLAGAVMLAFTSAGNAALVANLGADPNAGVSHTAVGNFTDDYTFTLTQDSTITVVGLINTFAGGLGSGQFIANFAASIFEEPGNNLVLGPVDGQTGCGAILLCQSLSGTATLGIGDYVLEVTGTGGANASYGGDITTVAAVPEPSTWAMMILGFAGIVVMAAKRRRDTGRAFRLA